MGSQTRINTANPLKSKIETIVTRKLSVDKNFLKVVDYISPMMENIDIDNHSERRLSKKLESRELELNKEYLVAFSKVNQIIQKFDKIVQNMNQSCTDLCTKLDDVKQTNTNLLNQTTQLQELKKKLDSKQKAIDSFMAKYSLTECELETLDCEHKDVPLTPQFFAALNRAKEIHDESKEMLKISGNHIAALEVMDSTSKIMKTAYTTIFNKISREFRMLGSDYNNAKNIISRALASLQDFPYMLQVSLDEYSTSRGNDVLRLFIEALTKGPDSSGKPIEMMSHNKIRYIGDMIAFIFELAGNEKDLLESLLSQCEPEVLKKNECAILGNITKVLSAPFKVRVEQSVLTETESVVLYRVSSLFTFYTEKISPIVGNESELVLTMIDLHNTCMSVFYAKLIHSVEVILKKMNTPDYDLLPVEAVNDCLKLLREVLDTHDSGIAVNVNAKDEFQKIFETILDPLTREIQLTATRLHSPLDVAVYTLNCLSSIQSAVVLYPFTDKRLEMISAMIESNEDVLVSESISNILSMTSLVTLYQKASAHQKSQGPLAQLPGMDKESVGKTLGDFVQFLQKSNVSCCDHVEKISNSRIRKTVRFRSMNELLKVYSCLVNKFDEEGNGYGEMNYAKAEQVEELLKVLFMQ